VQGLDHESIHNETGLHVGDPRAEGLVAVDPERALCHCPVGKYRVAMPHQHDRPAISAAGEPRRHTVAICGVGDGLAEDAGGFEMSPQAVSDGVDTAFVVATGVDVHEVRRQCDHRLMLPPQMLDDSGFCFDAHGWLRGIRDYTLPPDGGFRQKIKYWMR